MEQFKIIQPSTILAPYVKHYWLLVSNDVTHLQRIIPTGNISLVFHRGSRMKSKNQLIPVTSLSGQSLSFTNLIPTGIVNMIAVVFHPFGAKAFFKIPLCELENLMVSAEDMGIDRLQQLEYQILNTVDDRMCIQLIESFLISCMQPFKAYNYKRMAAAIHKINLCNSSLSIAILAETVCLSKKQFQRIFSEHIGTTPKNFIRIVRFHKALYILQNNHTINFTTLAYECGYYDQAHMINEFKFFSGYTPSEYIKVCKPYSDYFS